MNKSKNGKMIGVKEIAEKIGMSERWVYDRMKKGTLPFPWYRLSPKQRAANSVEIDTWLESVKVPAGSLPY